MLKAHEYPAFEKIFQKGRTRINAQNNATEAMVSSSGNAIERMRFFSCGSLNYCMRQIFKSHLKAGEGDGFIQQL